MVEKLVKSGVLVAKIAKLAMTAIIANRLLRFQVRRYKNNATEWLKSSQKRHKIVNVYFMCKNGPSRTDKCQ